MRISRRLARSGVEREDRLHRALVFGAGGPARFPRSLAALTCGEASAAFPYGKPSGISSIARGEWFGAAAPLAARLSKPLPPVAAPLAHRVGRGWRTGREGRAFRPEVIPHWPKWPRRARSAPRPALGTVTRRGLASSGPEVPGRGRGAPSRLHLFQRQHLHRQPVPFQDSIGPEPQFAQVAQPAHGADGKLGVGRCLSQIRQQLIEVFERGAIRRPVRQCRGGVLGDAPAAALGLLDGKGTTFRIELG